MAPSPPTDLFIISRRENNSITPHMFNLRLYSFLKNKSPSRFCICLLSRCNEGNNRSASWNPADSSHCNRRRILPQEMQNDLEHPTSQDLPPPPPPSPLTHPLSVPLLEKHIVTTSNGRSDLLGRALGQGLGPGQGGSGQGLSQCRSLGVGDCGPGLSGGRTSLVQELSELEGQILVIKQQLQSAMRRKRELEQYQSENQHANQTAANQPSTHQSNQFAQYTQSHQQTNQHTNTLPDFWSLRVISFPKSLVKHGTSFLKILSGKGFSSEFWTRKRRSTIRRSGEARLRCSDFWNTRAE